MRSDFCYFSDKRNHLVAQCIPWAICLCPICFTSSHLHSLPLTLKFYHTAALFKHHLSSDFIRQFAQLLADAFVLFLVTMHDGILKQGAWPAVAHARRRLKSLDRPIVLVLRSAQREGGSSLCGIAIISTPPTGFAPRRFSYPRYCGNLLWQPCPTL